MKEAQGTRPLHSDLTNVSGLGEFIWVIMKNPPQTEDHDGNGQDYGHHKIIHYSPGLAFFARFDGFQTINY